MRVILSFILMFSMSVSLSAQINTHQLQTIVDSFFAKNPEMIGVLVHVESPEKNISWTYARGNDGINTTKKLDVHQPMLIASTTKTYMAATILRLEEQGKLNINQSIKELINEQSRDKLTKADYQLDSITILHLLSHTSGIRDYVDEGYYDFIGKNKTHQWTRNEQIARAASLGLPLGKAGDVFRYADVNYVLLSEIIEHITHQPFYVSLRKLLNFNKYKIKNTWFIQLEKQPKNSAALVNQYASSFSWNIRELNPSWDMYGGGGMASNVKEMAGFFQLLFNGKIIKNKKVLQLMYTNVPPNMDINYCLGIRKIKVDKYLGYNHGGGLGTDVTYFPALNTTISIASVEADKRNIALQIRDLIITKLANNNSH